MVEKFGVESWHKVSRFVAGKTEEACRSRWQDLLEMTPVSNKGNWTIREDKDLLKLVESMGAKNWNSISDSLTGRTGKQCRERWHNHLDPNIRKEKWSA